MRTSHKIRGFSLVELMIGLTLGLLLIGAVGAVFINTSNTRAEMERAGRQIENGRYAIQVLTDDLMMAGYYGEFDPTGLDTPIAIPDPCSTDTNVIAANIPIHVQGFDQGANAPSCVTDVKSGTDIIALRRVVGCVAGGDGCEAQDGNYFYYQTTLCNAELAASSSDHFVISNNNSDFDLTKRNCADRADLRRYVTHIYFIANNNNSGDGIPTLKRAELKVGGVNIEPLVEGIENLQLSYGLDTDSDGSPDVYTAAPETHDGCAGQGCVENLRNIMATNISLLSRSTEVTPDYTDSKTYTLAIDVNGDPQTITPGGGFKRHAYNTLIRVNNPAGRREKP